jgi:pentatricopeptide repeat protein
MLSVATGVGNLRLGQQILGLVARATSVHNVFINNSLLDFYSKCDCIGEMEKLFDGMPECDNVSYNVMFAGYAWRRCAGTVLRLFREMQTLGFDRQALPYATLLSVAVSATLLLYTWAEQQTNTAGPQPAQNLQRRVLQIQTEVEIDKRLGSERKGGFGRGAWLGECCVCCVAWSSSSS